MNVVYTRTKYCGHNQDINAFKDGKLYLSILDCLNFLQYCIWHLLIHFLFISMCYFKAFYPLLLQKTRKIFWRIIKSQNGDGWAKITQENTQNLKKRHKTIRDIQNNSSYHKMYTYKFIIYRQLLSKYY
jgi:hypothetical protein